MHVEMFWICGCSCRMILKAELGGAFIQLSLKTMSEV